MPKAHAAAPVREVQPQQQPAVSEPRDPAMIADEAAREREYARRHRPTPPSWAHVLAKMAEHALARGGTPAKVGERILPTSLSGRHGLRVRGARPNPDSLDEAVQRAASAGREVVPPNHHGRQSQRDVAGVRPSRPSGRR